MPIWPQEVAGEFARRRLEVDASVVEELAQHAAAAYEAARAEGLAGPEAEASVRALIHSWCSATTGPRRLHRVALVEAAPAGRSPFAGLGLDLRQAVRLLVREPGSSAVSIVMIALALAATTSLFSVVNGVLLKPLPWAKLDGLVRVYETGVTRPSATPVVTNLTYRAWAEAPQTIEGLGGWSDVSMALDGPSGVELVRLGRVTASLFPLLGIAPSLGVAFTEADERTDAAVILSHGFWQERFGGAPCSARA
jgi:hypothetical protein